MVRGGLLAALLLLASAVALPQLEPQSRAATVLALADAALADLEETLPKTWLGVRPPYEAVLLLRGDAPAFASLLGRRLSASKVLKVGDAGYPLRVELDLSADPPSLVLGYAEASRRPVRVEAHRAPIRPWALLPPLLAIVLAFATGRLALSLVTAILCGAIVAAGPNPLDFLVHAFVAYVWEATLTEPFNLYILAFTVLLLGLVGLATRAGGVQGIVDRLTGLARDARTTKLVAFLLGVAIFFDDYANTVLVGTTMRPLADARRISREKLAYIVDSTSAPVAGIAFVSTWIGYEVGLLSSVARGLGLEQSGYPLFFAALPFRFYCFFALAFLLVLLLSSRDFGPMLRAERRAATTGAVHAADARPLSSRTFGRIGPAPGVPHLAHVALLPIAAVLLLTLLGLFVDGGGFAAVAREPGALLSFAVWREAFANAEHSTLVLALAAVAGSLLLFGLVLARRLLDLKEAARTYGQGVASMYLAVIILILAWAMKAVCDDVGTGLLLVATLRDVVAPAAVPLLVFLLAALVSFATGTSWGTMGILIPTAVPLAYYVGGEAMTLMAMAAVLDGSIFGDHCSPISDTTVMSSIATGCDHLHHVRTQIPYALTVMGVAALFGYAWNALGLGYGLGWLLAIAAIVAIVFLLGRSDHRRPETQAGSER